MYSSDITERRRARTIYASYVAQHTQWEKGCLNRIAVQNGITGADEELITLMKEANYIVSSTEL